MVGDGDGIRVPEKIGRRRKPSFSPLTYVTHPLLMCMSIDIVFSGLSLEDEREKSTHTSKNKIESSNSILATMS